MRRSAPDEVGTDHHGVKVAVYGVGLTSCPKLVPFLSPVIELLNRPTEPYWDIVWLSSRYGKSRPIFERLFRPHHGLVKLNLGRPRPTNWIPSLHAHLHGCCAHPITSSGLTYGFRLRPRYLNPLRSTCKSTERKVCPKHPDHTQNCGLLKV